MPRTINRTKNLGSGRATVVYRASTGKTYEAVITSAGAGANQLNLRIPALKGTASATKANVDRATADHGANALNKWFL